MGIEYPERGVGMPTMMTRIQVEDYDAWKTMFDSGRSEIRGEAKGHRIYRALDDPRQVSIAVDFESADAAVAARERLEASGAFERVDLKVAPTIVEETEAVTY